MSDTVQPTNTAEEAPPIKTTTAINVPVWKCSCGQITDNQRTHDYWHTQNDPHTEGPQEYESVADGTPITTIPIGWVEAGDPAYGKDDPLHVTREEPDRIM